VALAARRPRQQRALQIRSQRPPFVATMLVRRAYCLPLQERANIVYAQNVNDGSAQALVVEIRNALRQMLYPGEVVDDATLDFDLANSGDRHFAVVSVSALDQPLVDALLQSLPDVTFVFVLVSAVAATGVASQGKCVPAVDPEPGSDAVNQAFSAFRSLFIRLQLTRPAWANLT
jgi:hypothetical protein